MKVKYRDLVQQIIVTSTSLSIILVCFIILMAIMNPILLSPIFDYHVSHVVNKNQKDDYVIMVSELCKLNDNNFDKIECVYNYFNVLYKAKETSRINDINYTLSTGADCKNSAIFYCSVMKKMGIKCEFRYIPGHVYAIAQFEEGYCKIDQTDLSCFEFG